MQFLGAADHEFRVNAAAAMPTTTATSLMRHITDRAVFFLYKCAGMAFFRSAKVNGGASDKSTCKISQLSAVGRSDGNRSTKRLNTLCVLQCKHFSYRSARDRF